MSDSAARIADTARRRATALSAQQRVRDYLKLFDKLDALIGNRRRLETERQALQARLEAASSRQDVAEPRIRHLEKDFETILDKLEVPKFPDELHATIDRNTYLPVIYGRRFDNLSSLGLQVLVNVAYALAHHRTSIDLDLKLPAILMIDGLTSNVGHEGFDLDRVNKAFSYLIHVSSEMGDRLQIIVADGNIPAEAEPFVRLRLAEDDRLIPNP